MYLCIRLVVRYNLVGNICNYQTHTPVTLRS